MRGLHKKLDVLQARIVN